MVAVLVIAGVATRRWTAAVLDLPAIRNWTTVFLAVCVQALPFLALGVATSGLLAAFLPPDALVRVLPGRAALAVPAAALAGGFLPGCECGSVPIAARLVRRGAPAASALAFLLAAPAINPIVLVATSVAFPGQPRMVLARFSASLLAAVVVGLVWARWGRVELAGAGTDPAIEPGHRLAAFFDTALHDTVHAGGFLVLGGMTAATLQSVVPRSFLDHLARSGPLAVVTLGLLAVLIAICSEADAFVAASMVQFSLTARLAFLVVGPMVDVKLIALQAGTFGRRFTVRFAPLTFLVALGSAVLVGWLLL